MNPFEMVAIIVVAVMIASVLRAKYGHSRGGGVDADPREHAENIRLREEVKELKERTGLTVLMAEQNFHQAIRIADRGYIIVHGEIVFEGGVRALESNELVKNYYLGAAV